MKIVSALKWAIKGDAISSTYSQEQLLGDYGTKKLWKIYQGSIIADKKKVAIFVLTKSSLKIYPKENREYYVSLMAKSVDALANNKYPVILKIIAPFTETKDGYCFVTEPVIGTLETLINAKKFNPQLVVEDKLKYGICSLVSGIKHLNHSRIFLQCLIPSEILITPDIRWRIGGAFYLSTPNCTVLNIQKYSDDCPSIINIPYGYVAPENLMDDGFVGGFGDVFSLGSLLITIFNAYYRNDTSYRNPLIVNNLKEFHTQLDHFKYSDPSCLQAIPPELLSTVKGYLQREAINRSTLDDMIQNKYFHNINITTLTSVDFIPNMTIVERKKFLLSLQNVLNALSLDTITTGVIPALLEHMYDEEFTVICFKNFISLIQQSDFQPSSSIDLSRLKYLVDSPNMEVLALLIENLDLFSKFPETALETNYAKVICKGLQSTHVQCQKLAMDVVKVKLENQGVTFTPTYTIIIPSIGKLLANNRVATLTHINAFISLAHSLTLLDFRQVEQLIFPILFMVTNTEVAYIMAYLGLVQSIYDQHKNKIDSEIVLTKLTPILQRMVMHPCFNQNQVTKFKVIIYKLMDTAFNELMCIRPAGPPVENSNIQRKSSVPFDSHKPTSHTLHANNVQSHVPIKGSTLQSFASNVSTSQNHANVSASQMHTTMLPKRPLNKPTITTKPTITNNASASMFSAPPTSTNNASASMFSAPPTSTNNPSSSMFSAAPTITNNVSSSLFSAPPTSTNNASSSMFSAAPTITNNASASMFSAPPTSTKNASSSMFSAPPTSTNHASSSLFSAAPTSTNNPSSSMFSAAPPIRQSNPFRDDTPSVVAPPTQTANPFMTQDVFGYSNTQTTPFNTNTPLPKDPTNEITLNFDPFEILSNPTPNNPPPNKQQHPNITPVQHRTPSLKYQNPFENMPPPTTNQPHDNSSGTVTDKRSTPNFPF